MKKLFLLMFMPLCLLPATVKSTDIPRVPGDVLPKSDYSAQPATVKFLINGYRSEAALQIATEYNVFGESEIQNVEVPVNEDGCAELRLYTSFPTRLFFAVGDICEILACVVPGYEVSCEVTFDDDGNRPHLKFGGVLATTNNEMNALNGIWDMEPSFPDSLCYAAMNRKSTEERVTFLNRRLEHCHRKIDNLDCSENIRRFLRMKAENAYLRLRMNFPVEWGYICLRLFLNPQTDFEKFDSICNTARRETTDEMYDNLPYLECIDSDYFTYNNAWRFYAGMADVVQTENRFNTETFRTHNLLTGKEDIREEDIRNMAYVPYRELLKARMKRDKQWGEELTCDSVFFHSFDGVAPEQIMQTILDRYEGKAVFADFWGTYCKPCIMGHRRMEPMKEKYKDVVFVYIASPTSPAELWREMIKDIKGDHYYLTREQVSYITDRIIGEYGIPAYLFYNKSHELMFRHVGLPATEKLEEILSK